MLFVLNKLFCEKHQKKLYKDFKYCGLIVFVRKIFLYYSDEKTKCIFLNYINE